MDLFPNIISYVKRQQGNCKKYQVEIKWLPVGQYEYNMNLLLMQIQLRPLIHEESSK